MAHLSHKLPWNSLASLLTFTHERKDVTPRYADLYCKDTQKGPQALRYFLKALGDTIRDFAASERKKYPTTSQIKKRGRLFASSVLDNALPYMQNKDLSRHGFNAINLRDTEYIENWIAHAGPNPDPSYDNTYNEAAALLLVENEMSALLTLARNPDVDLDRLGQAAHNYQYAWTHTVLQALQLYIACNIIYCKPELWTQGKTDHLTARSFDTVMRHLTTTLSGDLIYLSARKCFGLDPCESNGSTDPFEDLDKLGKFLKECFAILVRFEMVERESGRPVEWESYYAGCFLPGYMHQSSMFHFGAKFEWGDIRYSGVIKS